jgi:carbonic anhydrase
VGSIEFAVESFGTPLVVVLGHSNCGAILGTIDACENPDAEHSENLQAILEHIRPAVEPLLRAAGAGERDAVVDEAIRANVRATAAGIAAQSNALAARIRAGALLIVGAEYDLETGAVDFFHVPGPATT